MGPPISLYMNLVQCRYYKIKIISTSLKIYIKPQVEKQITIINTSDSKMSYFMFKIGKNKHNKKE
jgi:hypothetical protein